MARIILIDDDRTTLMAIRALLEKLGHQVVVAEDGADGVECFLEEEPDVVITDIFMPRQDGLETLRRLRRLNPDVRVICMSAGPSRLDQSEEMRDTMLTFAEEFGALATLAKPVESEQLRAVLDRVLAAG